MSSDGNPITSVLGETFTRGDGAPPANVLAVLIAGHELPATGFNLALTLALGVSLISPHGIPAGRRSTSPLARHPQPHITSTWFLGEESSLGSRSEHRPIEQRHLGTEQAGLLDTSAFQDRRDSQQHRQRHDARHQLRRHHRQRERLHALRGCRRRRLQRRT